MAEHDSAAALVEKLNTLADGVAAISKGMLDLDAKVEERSKAVTPAWLSGNGPGIIVGESPNGSRPFNVLRLAKGLLGVAGRLSDDARNDCKLELDFAARTGSAFGCGTYAIPMSSNGAREDNDAEIKVSKEWKQMRQSQASAGQIDQDRWQHIAKTLLAGNEALGGSFVPAAATGEMIDLLRATSLFEQIPGTRQVTLPPQGRLHFPRVTGSVTISSYAESATTTASTPATGGVLMEARKYSGLVKMTEEWLKFAVSVEGDAFVRLQIALDSQLKADRDTIDGPGGTAIRGLITYSGVTTQLGGTIGANGNTLQPADIDLLLAKMADANVPTNRGTAVALRNTLWAALKHRADDNGRPKFDAAQVAFGGGRIMQLYSGTPVYATPQISNTRVKGSGTDLSFVMAVVPSEIYIGRSGAMEMTMTNSDGTDFQTGTIALRGTQWIDVVPAHEESVGLIDQLLVS